MLKQGIVRLSSGHLGINSFGTGFKPTPRLMNPNVWRHPKKANADDKKTR